MKNISKFLTNGRIFSLCQRLGFNLVTLDYLSPVPKLSDLKENTWKNQTELFGINMRDDKQVNLLNQFILNYKEEYDAFPQEKQSVPHKFYNDNGTFRFVDACISYSMIRHFKPERIFEVGSGFSTLLSAQALLRNKEETGYLSELTAFEPYPKTILKTGFPGLSKLEVTKAEDIDLKLFQQLENKDILFIDSSHVLKIGGDVKYLYLEVLPRLKSGVIVHCHDIFLPADYPEDWVVKNHWFWTEQYLLQAFLAFNDSFEVLWAGNYMRLKHPELLKKAFTTFNPLEVMVGSFWMRRK